MKWISIKDKEKPKDSDEEVRVKCKHIEGGMVVYGTGYYYGRVLDTWDIGLLSGPETYPLPAVTHWQPLHPPIKEEADATK